MSIISPDGGIEYAVFTKVARHLLVSIKVRGGVIFEVAKYGALFLLQKTKVWIFVHHRNTMDDSSLRWIEFASDGYPWVMVLSDASLAMIHVQVCVTESLVQQL